MVGSDFQLFLLLLEQPFYVFNVKAFKNHDQVESIASTFVIRIDCSSDACALESIAILMQLEK